jgi:hypothetical protein
LSRCLLLNFLMVSILVTCHHLGDFLDLLLHTQILNLVHNLISGLLLKVVVSKISLTMAHWED